MVSPSKKQKVNGKWVRLKEGDRVKKSPEKKPLKGKHYYLDVKGQADVRSLTRDLESLGAVIEAFLSKDIDIIVTDQRRLSGTSVGRGNASPATPTRPATRGILSGANGGAGVRQLRSRVDAMLDQARSKRRGTSDVLANAQRWGTEIWSVKKAVEYIAGLKKAALPSPQKSDTVANRRLPVVSVRRLSVPYIKVEDCEEIPIYRELVRWPVLRVRTGSLSSPFEDANQVTERKKRITNIKKSPRQQGRHQHQEQLQRQQRQVSVANVQAAKRSYCEICGVTYRSLAEHLKCELHLRFVSDERNYEELDRLIKEGNGKDVGLQVFKGSISRNSEEEPVRRCLRSARVYSEPQIKKGLTLRNGTTYGDQRIAPSATWTNSYPAKEKRPVLVEGTFNGQRRRTVSGMVSTNNNNLASSKSALSAVSNGLASIEFLKRDCQQKRRKVAGDEKFLRDNEQYYKVEVLPSKLRSSRQHVNGDSLKRRRVKVRRNASQMCLSEAEVFLFGEQDSSDEEDSEEEPGEKEAVLSEKEKRREGKGGGLKEEMGFGAKEAGLEAESELVEGDEELKGKDASPSEKGGQSEAEADDDDSEEAKQKRRRSCEVRLISDNHEYYKFEILSSKLRSTHRIHRRASLTDEESRESNDNPDQDLPEWMSRLKFSFESVPVGEPWFRTYQRQDNGDVANSVPDAKEEKPHFLLPYELPQDLIYPKVGPGRRKSKSSSSLPRKSPRCHASTLALLMGISRQRLAALESADGDLEAYLKGVGGVANEEDIRAAGLEVGLGPSVKTTPTRGRPRKFKRPTPNPVTFCEPDVVSMVSEFSSCACLEKVEGAVSGTCDNGAGSDVTSTTSEADSTVTPFRRAKKRKRNMTGWPRDKPRQRKKPPISIAEPVESASVGRSEGKDDHEERTSNESPSSPPSEISTIHRREFPRQAKSQILVKVDYLPTRTRKSL